ncbi:MULTISPECIES: hypothetical protein [unclassified Nocardioides]|uniref:hypothetical protein n=1 Tax=unclassified Nocardioides TaxID=2615069 RepID=UPI0006F5217D|nr:MULTISPECIES: hypothetical protein [unclassified Nocardioides]KQY54300.1 hypothetical protein ASD30_19010 [Nocardioides sp. Root140]KQZ74923.1 hypothetical protein ASD66_00605 [Nocardioides sp. Root151]
MNADVLESVRTLLPDIRKRAERTELDRKVSTQTMSALTASGLFRMLQPRTHGGLESDPKTFFTAIRAVAAACGSTGWVASIIGATHCHVALMEPQAAEDVWGKNPDARVTASYGPVGRMTPESDGYRLSGEWNAAAGAEHADWFLLGALLVGPAHDVVDYSVALVPRSDLTLTDDWNVVGLRGSGSKGVVVSGVVVPAHRVYASIGRTRVEERRSEPGTPALYRIPLIAVYSTSISVPLVGTAEGAYDYHLDRMRDRAQFSHGGSKGNDDNFLHAALARGLTELDATVLQVDRNLDELYDLATRNAAIPVETRLRARRDQVRSTERAVEAIDLLLKVSGGHGVRNSTVIQRCWRDVHTGAAHLVNNVEQSLVPYGRWASGYGVDDALILS